MKQKEKSTAVAAAKAGMSEKTARKYLKAEALPSQMKKERHWRTREDPFKDAWPEIKQLLKVDVSLQAKTIFDYLCRKSPEKYSEGQLRTLQRKIKQWKAVEGPEKEVVFPQIREAGVQCQSDYTCMNELAITIAHQPFKHLLYHFVLPYSNWEWATVCFSESLESLKKGLQDALWRLGGVPTEHRTDNLSAAVNNLQDVKEFNSRYAEVLKHYGMRGSRNFPGNAHENGDVEQSHYRLKMALDQELRLRGGRDFASREDYKTFVEEVVNRRNKTRSKRFEEERKTLKSLPNRRLGDFSEIQARVSRFCTLSVRKNVYSVDSRLIGEKVTVRIYAEELEVYCGGQKVETLPRLRGSGGHRINYRHIIDSLLRKPGAFAGYKYRKDLYPRFVFRLTYDRLVADKPHEADREYVKILGLAAKVSEDGVETVCDNLLKAGCVPTSKIVEERLLAARPAARMTLKEPCVNLANYDDLLGGNGGN